jgi:two-component system, NarL family, nitrate/nitrite response regulator NarL
MIKILIADDHQIVCDGIKNLLDEEENIKILGAVNTGEDAVEFCKSNYVDICLMDINMPIMNGIDATSKISADTITKVIAITNHQELAYIYKMINAGASGYILKISGKTTLMEAINDVSSGHKYFSPQVKELIENMDNNSFEQVKTPDISLSRREKEILRLIVLGYTNQEISATLFISKNTADTHRKNLLKKLNVNNTAGLVRLAYETNVLHS